MKKYVFVSSCDATLVASPSSVDLPGFDVDADVLARSPMGSVADLSTCIQSDNEDFADKINLDNSDAKSLDSVDNKIDNFDTKSLDSVDQGLTSVDGATLSKAHADSIDSCQSDVDIVLTSPKGTKTSVKEEEEEDVKTENVEVESLPTAEENVDKENVDKNESSEFVNSQGVTFKPTAETVDDSG